MQSHSGSNSHFWRRALGLTPRNGDKGFRINDACHDRLENYDRNSHVGPNHCTSVYPISTVFEPSYYIFFAHSPSAYIYLVEKRDGFVRIHSLNG